MIAWLAVLYGFLQGLPWRRRVMPASVVLDGSLGLARRGFAWLCRLVALQFHMGGLPELFSLARSARNAFRGLLLELCLFGALASAAVCFVRA